MFFEINQFFENINILRGRPRRKGTVGKFKRRFEDNIKNMPQKLTVWPCGVSSSASGLCQLVGSFERGNEILKLRAAW